MKTIKDTKQLGAEIRTQRRQLGVTQKDLAMTSGTGLRFIIELEKGKSTCQIGKSIRVMQTLGMIVLMGEHNDVIRPERSEKS